VTTPLPGRDIDIYTQYPAPFGGQGPNMPSDMFWPQKEVILYADVTYNWWPMQQKLVGFEVEDPTGTVWAKLSNVTDVNGQAWFKFRLPWPCDDPESLFGVWHITATVDVACTVINDTLDFHYDYQARIFKVTIAPPPCLNDMNFAHCDNVTLTIDYGTHSQQALPALFSVVLYDEVGVPVAFNFATVQNIGGTVYCQYKNGTVTITVHIPKFAVAGVGTFHINVYDTDPTEGGIPYAPEFTPRPTIFITPY